MIIMIVINNMIIIIVILSKKLSQTPDSTANLPINILCFRGFDSCIININSKGWNSHVNREFLESLSQQILAGIILVGRLGHTACKRSVRNGVG